jgi:hypothetical protein
LSIFVEALLQAAGTTGAVVVWNQAFEATRIRELAEMFPQHAEALNSIIERMVDLLPIYREHYYHPAMMGSWSIKAVLPTIAPDLDYSNLEVGDGGAAQEAYLRAISPSVSDSRARDVASGTAEVLRARYLGDGSACALEWVCACDGFHMRFSRILPSIHELDDSVHEVGILESTNSSRQALAIQFRQYSERSLPLDLTDGLVQTR